MSDTATRVFRTIVQVLVGAVPIVAGSALVGVDTETVAAIAGVLALTAALASLVQNSLEDHGLIKSRK